MRKRNPGKRTFIFPYQSCPDSIFEEVRLPQLACVCSRTEAGQGSDDASCRSFYSPFPPAFIGSPPPLVLRREDKSNAAPGLPSSLLLLLSHFLYVPPFFSPLASPFYLRGTGLLARGRSRGRQSHFPFLSSKTATPPYPQKQTPLPEFALPSRTRPLVRPLL